MLDSQSAVTKGRSAEVAGPMGTGLEELAFGRHVVLPSARTLLCAGKAVPLGARAFDILVLLLSRPGRIVSKEMITSYVWPTTTVDESNLRFQLTCLRRALGPDRERIKTVTGRGYLFVPDDVQDNRKIETAKAIQAEGDKARAVRKSAIVIIDEDPEYREALQRLLRPLNADVLSFVSIEAFRESETCAANFTS